MDVVDPNGGYVAQPNFHGGQGQVVDGAILENFSALGEVVTLGLYLGNRDGATGKPGTTQFG